MSKEKIGKQILKVNRNIAMPDASVLILSMHAIFEVVGKLDCYKVYRICKTLRLAK